MMNRKGFLSIQVLPELIGNPITNTVFSYISGLNPRAIASCYKDAEVKTVGKFPGTVTIFHDMENIITGIEMYVEVILPEFIENRYELALHRKGEVRNCEPEHSIHWYDSDRNK